jgi:hypothetical protein
MDLREKKLGESHSQSRRGDEEKKYFLLPEIKIRFAGPLIFIHFTLLNEGFI